LLLEKLNVPRKIGFGNFSALTDKVNASPGIQRTARAVTLLRILDSNADITTLPKLDVTSVPLPDEMVQIPKFVAIAPGSVWKTKRWPAQHFASVATTMFELGLTPLFIGSRQDQPAMLEVRRTLAAPHVDLVGRTTIPQVAAIIARAKFLVANDSAPVHIATAVGTPSVVVFGPTVKQFGFAPPAELGIVIENSGLWCRPCTSHGSNECPIHTHECMTSISAERVVDAGRKFAEFNGI
jgi:heptosyltransferase-2